MAIFITHIELFHASDKDYEKLDRAMKALHFYTTIQDLTTGIMYQLPANTYHSSSPEETSFVLQQARNAAKKTKRNYSAITVKSDGIQFTGLEIAAATPSS